LGTLRLAFLGPVFLAGLAIGGELREQKRVGGGNDRSEGCRQQGYFFLPATVLRAPRRVRALVRVRWPRTGRPMRWRRPRKQPMS
jgi:hypothetical protein